MTSEGWLQLLQPTAAEAGDLLGEPPTFSGYTIVSDALPSRYALEEGISLIDGPGTRRYRWGMPYLICLAASRTVVGTIGGKGLLGIDTKVEIGYNVAPPYRRRGICSAAIREIQKLATKDGLDLLAHVEIANYASQRALERNGFSLEKLIDWPGDIQLQRWSWLADEY